MNINKLKDMLTIAMSSENHTGEDKISTQNIKEMVRDKTLTEVNLCNHKDVLLKEHELKLVALYSDGHCLDITDDNIGELESEIDKSHGDFVVVIVSKGVYRNPEIAVEFYSNFISEDYRNNSVVNDPYMHWCVHVNFVLNTAFDDFVEFRTYWSESFWNLCRMRGYSVSKCLVEYNKHIA